MLRRFEFTQYNRKLRVFETTTLSKIFCSKVLIIFVCTKDFMRVENASKPNSDLLFGFKWESLFRALILEHKSEVARGEIRQRRENRVELGVADAKPSRQRRAVLRERDAGNQNPARIEKMLRAERQCRKRSIHRRAAHRAAQNEMMPAPAVV